jgi:photosystem II stability/assembly factor-like uncharacterized protein
LEGRLVASLTVSTLEPQVLAVGTRDQGHTVYISEDGGLTWRESSTCLGSCDVYALAQDADHPEILYAATVDRLWKSEDLGYHWDYVPIRTAPFSRLSGLAAAPSLAGRLYVTAWETCASFFVSGDAGATWEPRQALELCSYNPLDSSVVVSWQDPDVVYVARAHDRPEILRTRDGGLHWERLTDIGTGLGVNDMVLCSEDDQHLYAATFGGGVHTSWNSGASWSCASLGLPGACGGTNVTALCLDPRNEETVFAAVAGHGIFQSEDEGDWWQAFGSLPVGVHVYELAMAAGVPWRLWAATDDGLWLYEWPSVVLPLVFRDHLVVGPTATRTPTPTRTMTPTPTSPGIYPPPTTATPTVTGVASLTPTATVTGAASPTPTAIPSASLIVDPGFESRTGWVIRVTPHMAAYSMAQAHSGLWSLRLGIVPPDPAIWAFSSAYQALAIPASATRVTLKFWWRRYTEEPYTYASDAGVPLSAANGATLDNLGYTEDCHEVLLLANDYQTVLSFLARGLANDTAWVYEERDLTPWRGRQVALYFDAYNHTDLSQRTWMYVDDVTVEVEYP